ncbi:MAG: Na+/H+ antiporter NhaC family protein, partial [Bacilli bacterium]
MHFDFLSVIPALIIIISIFITKRVLLSLTLGILAGGWIVGEFKLVDMFDRLCEAVIGIVYADGQLQTGNLSIVLFLITLGLLTGMIQLLGGNAALAVYAHNRIASMKKARLSIVGMGLTIFPDDVFNMFVTGQVGRPIADARGISRTKLAYFLHTTSDPLCVLCPISSWGAYIISIFTVILSTHSLSGSGLGTFVSVVPFNFYALTSIIFVFFVAYFGIDFGPMRTFEMDAQQKRSCESNATHTLIGKMYDLMIPIALLMVIS